MFQNLKKRTRNREDISKILTRLLYRVGILEEKISEGGGEIPASYNIPLTTTVEISSVQLLALATTPVELIPAPGDGKYIVVDSVIIVYNYGTEAYNHDNLLTINGNVSSPFLISLEGTESFKHILYNESNELFENTPILLEYNGTASTTGDGTLKLILTYRIITI